jgi:hypothetical protein
MFCLSVFCQFEENVAKYGLWPTYLVANLTCFTSFENSIQGSAVEPLFNVPQFIIFPHITFNSSDAKSIICLKLLPLRFLSA